MSGEARRLDFSLDSALADPPCPAPASVAVPTPMSPFRVRRYRVPRPTSRVLLVGSVVKALGGRDGILSLVDPAQPDRGDVIATTTIGIPAAGAWVRAACRPGEAWWIEAILKVDPPDLQQPAPETTL